MIRKRIKSTKALVTTASSLLWHDVGGAQSTIAVDVCGDLPQKNCRSIQGPLKMQVTEAVQANTGRSGLQPMAFYAGETAKAVTQLGLVLKSLLTQCRRRRSFTLAGKRCSDRCRFVANMASIFLHADPAGGERLVQFYSDNCGMTRLWHQKRISLVREVRPGEYFAMGNDQALSFCTRFDSLRV
jgi:hypothetical protein